MNGTDEYYLSKEEPTRSCLLTLRKIILEQEPGISESLKWNIPCFMYQKKMFCFLNTEKKTRQPYILMVKGNYLNHAELEKGDRTRMKILRIDHAADIPVQTIQTVLNEALNLYKKGTIKIDTEN